MLHRNNLLFFFIASIFGLSLLTLGCKPQKIPVKEQSTEEMLRAFEKLYENKLSIPPQEIPFAYINKELDIRVKGEIDLQTQQVKLDYEMQNRKEIPEAFTFRNPIQLQDSLPLRIAKNGKQPFRFSERIDTRQISENTKYAHISPYLMIRKEHEPYKILFGNYDINLKVKLPEGARIIRSTVPLEMVTPTTASWEMGKLDILPPIDIWYTLSEEKVELKKETGEEGEFFIIRITVSNIGDSPARDLKLSCRIPNTFAIPVPERSDGTFELSQGVMHLWSFSLPMLNPNSLKQATIVLRADPPSALFNVPKIMVHNKEGELLAVD